MTDPVGGGPKLAAVGMPALASPLEMGLPGVGEVDNPREVGDHFQTGEPRARGRKRYGREDAQTAPEDPPGEQSHTVNLTGFGASAPLRGPNRWSGGPPRPA